MSKELDLDFSEISKSKRADPPPPSAPPKSAPMSDEAVKPLGINIALEYDDGVILKDLAELSGEQFLQWASRVFPVLDQKLANPRDYDSRSQKAAAFDHILRFHTNSIFHVKKELTGAKLH